MDIKIKYTIKFLLGIIFIIGIALLGYWLLAVYKVESIIGHFAIGIFIIIPFLKTLATLPNEFHVLTLIWSSDTPKDIEDAANFLRERNRF